MRKKKRMNWHIRMIFFQCNAFPTTISECYSLLKIRKKLVQKLISRNQFFEAQAILNRFKVADYF